MPDFQQRVESLAQADAALQLAFQGSGIGLWYYDMVAGRAWQSAAMREMYGYASEAADVEALAQLHPEDAPAVRAILADIAAGRMERFECECRVQHAAGGYRWTLVRGSVAQRDATGQPCRLFGLSVDIHDRRIAEQERDAGRRLVQTVIESIPAMVFWKDRKGVYQGCNQVFARFVGRASPVDVVGRTDAELNWSPTGLASIQRTDALILAGQLELRNELRDIFLANQPHAALVSGLPMRAADGTIAGLLGVVVDVPDMQKAQEALRRGEQRWGAALGATGAAVLEIDYRTGTHYVSPQIGELLGYAPGELQWSDGSGIERAHPDDLAQVRRNTESIDAGRCDAVEHEFRLRCKDGGYKWFLVRGRVLERQSDGRPLRFIATHTDIDARKRAELAAESSRQLLHAIIDAIPHSIFWKNDHGVYLGCNAAFARKTRFGTPQALIGHTDVQIGWPAERLALIHEIDHAVLVRGRQMINQHVEVPAPDGVGHRLSTVLPFRHEASGFSGVIGVITDVTELQRVRARVRLAEKRWQVALESSGAAVWELDLEHGRIWHSPRLGAMLGFGPTALEFTLDQIDDLVHPDDLPVALARRARVDSGATDGIEMQYRLRCADGSYRWMLSRGAVVDRGPDGQPKRLVGTHTDIDDEYEGLDRAAQARQLESLGRLAAGVAHEINTPLQFVSDSVSFLRSGMDDIAQLAASCGQCGLERASVDMPRALELVQQGIMRIGEIVRGMRVFAHPDSEAMEPVRVEDLLRSALAIARHEYKQVAGIRTAFAELPLLPCHPGELSQVFVNVIVNAAHAIAERGGGGTSPGVIELRTSRDADSIVIEIEDTGCGIEPERLERIFDPFYTTKPSGQGTGQGLAIARTVVEQHHGGRIGARSRVGQGTVIRIVLPLRSSRDQAAA